MQTPAKQLVFCRVADEQYYMGAAAKNPCEKREKATLAGEKRPILLEKVRRVC